MGGKYVDMTREVMATSREVSTLSTNQEGIPLKWNISTLSIV